MQIVQPNSNNKILVIYHGDNCNDGFGAAWAAYKKFGNKADYVEAIYGEQPPDNLEKYELIYILDFTYPREQVLSIYEKCKGLFIIDHHATSAHHLKDLPFAMFDNNFSGATLAWKFFHHTKEANTIPLMLLYIEDRDLWKWKLENSREFSAALDSYPKDFETWNWINDNFGQLLIGGKFLIKQREQYVKNIVARHRWIELAGYNIPVVNTCILKSEVCEALYNQYLNEAKFSACYFDRQDGLREWSLRSHKDSNFDVSAIALKFGGGGHFNSAGFQEPIVESKIVNSVNLYKLTEVFDDKIGNRIRMLQ